MSARRQSSQWGVRAPHTWRPWRISRSENSPQLSGGSNSIRSCSTLTASVCWVSPRRRESRPTCVSTGRPGRSNATDLTTLPVLRPTPGRVVRLSRSVGTLPPWRSSSAAASPMRLRAFERKKPVEWMSVSSSSGSARARSKGEGYRRNRAGVTILTRASVHCAESTVATISWNGLACVRAHLAGYASSSLRWTSRACCWSLRACGFNRPVSVGSVLHRSRRLDGGRRSTLN